MNFHEVVECRRSVRSYTPVPVDQSVIEELIHAATLAPSAMNLQPWSFAVITGVARIDEYARRARAFLRGTAAFGEQAQAMLKDPEFNMFHHAPALVLVLATSSTEQAREDCCLAAQTLMLAARDKGIGTCWVGFGRLWLNLLATRAELGLSFSHEVVAPIVVGYPASWPQAHGRRQPQIRWVPDA